MSVVSFSDLTGRLPRGDDLKSRDLASGVTYEKAANPCFVPPDFEVEIPPEAGLTSVVLISAPGAVGKTTVAREIAARQGATIWDLSRIQVGSRTFSGTIMDSWGFEATGVLKRFAEGRFLFVLDALDEAQVRAGSQNFDAFLGDLAQAASASRSQPVLVLLARTDTADWIQLVLEDRGVSLARYKIRFFDEPRAISFIEKRLDARRTGDGKQQVHRQQPGPFVEARTRLFELIFELFAVPSDRAWGDARVADFLGYSPVLEALADYLDVTNYMALMQELEKGAETATDPWKFLTQIVDRLLVREQGKVQNAVRPQLEARARTAGWDEWTALYSPDEQCARVLTQLLPTAPAIETSLPGPLAEDYEDALQTITPQHPFLSGKGFANVVFKEFTYAWGVTQAPEPLVGALRMVMRDRESPFLPSQLYGRFILGVEKDGEVLLDGRDFGVFYDSVLSRDQDATLSILDSEMGATASLVFPDEVEEGEATIQLVDTGSGVHFWRRLGNADVVAKMSVSIGLPEQRFHLGPSVDIECDTLRALGGTIDVDASGDVALRAGYYEQNAQIRLRLSSEGEGSLVVWWPEVAHPWARYRGGERSAPRLLAETQRGDVLRKFILMFRRQRTRKAATLHQTRWSPEQLGDRDELIELALARGVLAHRPSQDVYAFNSDYDSLKGLIGDGADLSPAAKGFVVEYLGKAEAQKVLSD